jgi:hypothetical protein
MSLDTQSASPLSSLESRTPTPPPYVGQYHSTDGCRTDNMSTARRQNPSLISSSPDEDSSSSDNRDGKVIDTEEDNQNQSLGKQYILLRHTPTQCNCLTTNFAGSSVGDTPSIILPVGNLLEESIDTEPSSIPQLPSDPSLGAVLCTESQHRHPSMEARDRTRDTTEEDELSDEGTMGGGIMMSRRSSVEQSIIEAMSSQLPERIIRQPLFEDSQSLQNETSTSRKAAVSKTGGSKKETPRGTGANTPLILRQPTPDGHARITAIKDGIAEQEFTPHYSIIEGFSAAIKKERSDSGIVKQEMTLQDTSNLTVLSAGITRLLREEKAEDDEATASRTVPEHTSDCVEVLLAAANASDRMEVAETLLEFGRIARINETPNAQILGSSTLASGPLSYQLSGPRLSENIQPAPKLKDNSKGGEAQRQIERNRQMIANYILGPDPEHTTLTARMLAQPPSNGSDETVTMPTMLPQSLRRPSKAQSTPIPTIKVGGPNGINSDRSLRNNTAP